MNQNLTEVVAILDMSGSMSSLTDDTIGGYNKFVEGQKNAPGDANLTTVFFDDQYELKNDRVNIKNVQNITTRDYCPRGSTALYDAIGKTINSIGVKLSAMHEQDRPGKVLVLIITDGQENSSKEFGKDKIKSMIEEQRNKYNWEFVFMGANIDAMAAGSSIGIATNVQYSASAAGICAAYTVMNSVAASYRSTGSVGEVKQDITTKE